MCEFLERYNPEVFGQLESIYNNLATNLSGFPDARCWESCEAILGTPLKDRYGLRRVHGGFKLDIPFDDGGEKLLSLGHFYIVDRLGFRWDLTANQFDPWMKHPLTAGPLIVPPYCKLGKRFLTMKEHFDLNDNNPLLLIA